MHYCTTWIGFGSFLLASLCYSPLGFAQQQPSVAPYALLPTPDGQPLHLTLEIADTTQSREQGLMFRQQLPATTGMLFVFPETKDHVFWMKNTLIPLDMFFLDERGTIVGIIEHAEPHSLQTRGVGRASRFVLETNAGMAQKYKLKTGQQIRLEPPSRFINPMVR